MKIICNNTIILCNVQKKSPEIKLAVDQKENIKHKNIWLIRCQNFTVLHNLQFQYDLCKTVVLGTTLDLYDYNVSK